ncbi:hypothetical protein PBCVCvsA1_114L [Paramecium bursaria Chlorella virus CvsA1]|nr:hypothetical protein PBCVCvsA1_114L [Paramecium bursaria Chlorella virus CvsA1]AGE55135.1 hypothetical protein PBCVMA1E_027L [Paramecium bursaria Chlorella virus MA1E]
MEKKKKTFITGRYFRENVDAYMYYKSFDIPTIVRLSMMYRRIRDKTKEDDTSFEKIFRETFKRINGCECPWKFYMYEETMLHGTRGQISKLLTSVIDQRGIFYFL